MIKALLLDVDNTLLDFNDCARLSAIMTAKEMGVTLPTNFFPVFKEVNEMLWQGYEKGTLTKSDIRKNRWNNVFKALNICFDGSAFEEAFRTNMKFCATPVSGAESLLNYLYEKYPLYVASNASSEIQGKRLDLANFTRFFRYRFLSEDVGVAKPAREFWDFCLKSLALAPEEVIMIGDSPSADIVGAHNMGITTVWYNHDKLPTEGVPADYIVNSLDAIKEIL